MFLNQLDLVHIDATLVTQNHRTVESTLFSVVTVHINAVQHAFGRDLCYFGAIPAQFWPHRIRKPYPSCITGILKVSSKSDCSSVNLSLKKGCA